jgi:hypothetical protein
MLCVGESKEKGNMFGSIYCCDSRLFFEESKEWQRMSDPKEAETNILDKNKTHLRQAHGTPFTEGDLEQIQFSDTGPLADSILAGTAQSNDRVTQLVLDALKKPDGIPGIQNNLTLE